MTQTLYEEIIRILEDYLGPSAKRFVDRQVAFHLQKLPSDIDLSEIPNFVEWTRVTLGLLTEDHAMVDECADRLMALSH